MTGLITNGYLQNTCNNSGSSYPLLTVSNTRYIMNKAPTASDTPIIALVFLILMVMS